MIIVQKLSMSRGRDLIEQHGEVGSNNSAKYPIWDLFW